MAMNGVTAHKPATTVARRRPWISGVVWRVVIALIISWLIIMAFFVTSVK